MRHPLFAAAIAVGLISPGMTARAEAYRLVCTTTFQGVEGVRRYAVDTEHKVVEVIWTDETATPYPASITESTIRVTHVHARGSWTVTIDRELGTMRLEETADGTTNAATGVCRRATQKF